MTTVMMMRLVTAFALATVLADAAWPERGDDQYGDPPPENQGGQEAGGRREPEAHRRGRRRVLAGVRCVPEGPADDQPAADRGDPAYADAYNKGPVTNETAKKLLDEAVAIDDAEAKLKSASVPKILPCCPREGGALHPDREQDSGGRALRAGRGIPLVE